MVLIMVEQGWRANWQPLSQVAVEGEFTVPSTGIVVPPQ